MNKEQLKYVLTDGEERALPRVLPRDARVPLDSGKVVVLSGIRRSGKTSMLFEAIRRLLDTGVDRERIVYLNLEDDRLYPVEAGELDLILQAHAELHPGLASTRRYLFLDEVQAVEGWERFVRRIHDSGDWEIVLTGSSSRLLGKDMAAPMRGRSLRLEVHPLSFPEYLRFCGIELKPHSRASEARAVHSLEQYLEFGGFPEVVLAQPEWREAILDEYADLILYKDLIDGFGIGNSPVLKLMLKQCLGHPAGLFSPNRFFKALRSQGMQVAKDTVYAYLDHLEEAYVLFPVRKWDRSLRVRNMNPVKLYAIDHGLSGRFSITPDRGKRLENAVFHHLRARHRQGGLFYLANGHEVDLAAGDAAPEQAWNVSWSLNDPATRARELASLVWADRLGHGTTCSVICHEAPQAWNEAFPLIPAWRFLMEA